ncbi:GDSL-type esterase/lipase family protein [Desulfosoma sp.]|uniref:GDSL-type esterase/lipase family protein n=1 Tax=Desulfosoma sp. TaxID=2603217 RepID=UPI00404A709C
MMKTKASRFVLMLWLLAWAVAAPGSLGISWAGPSLVIVGDSLGEGVQSGDANLRTQPYSYGMWVARQARLNLTLPYIVSGPLGVVGDTSVRHRLFPYTKSSNLAVSGADSWSVLHDRALATSPQAITSETELVLFPRTGSQIEIVEALQPETVLCWIGNNDVLSAVHAYDQLNATRLAALMTLPQDFEANYRELVSRLSQSARHVVLADLPDVTDIAFLLDNEDLERFLGPGQYLDEGSRTTVAALFMILLGFANPSIFQNSDYVLDAAETAIVQERTEALNAVIHKVAQEFGFPVVKISKKFREYAQNPPVYAGTPIARRYLGGLFSLDGVHPSNIGHALAANEFLSTLQSRYGRNVPQLSESTLNDIAARDPFVDVDGDGRVRGRPLAGMLETIALLLGISGDVEDSCASRTAQQVSDEDRQRALSLLEALRNPSRRGAAVWSQNEIRRVILNLFHP